MQIGETEFNTFYPDLKGHWSFFNTKPANVAEFERNYLRNKLWRLNNLYRIVDKRGASVPFRMNRSQHLVYATSRLHPRLIILKSRQQGISTFWLVSFFDDALFCPNLTIGLMAQGTDEASMLLEKTKFLWENLHDDIKTFLGVDLEKDNTKEFSFTNHSTVFIRTSFRSTTLQRLHISEFGKIANASPKRARETKTGTLPALGLGNTGIIESTAEGLNLFKELWDAAVITNASEEATPKDFHPVFLSWTQDPDCTIEQKQSISEDDGNYLDGLEKELSITLSAEQKNFWITQYRELGSDIYQEYPSTAEEAFKTIREGTYYAKLFHDEIARKEGIVKNLYDENLPLDIYFDLGVDDYTVLFFVQWYQGIWRFVDEYVANGFGLTHYLEHILASRYQPRALRFPHDVRIRELGSSGRRGLAKSRLDIIREWIRKNPNLHDKWRVSVCPKTNVNHGIEAVRRLLPNARIDVRCRYLMDCLLHYSKEWDSRLEVWKNLPMHDHYSHGADALRLVASSTVESASYHESSFAQPRRIRPGYGEDFNKKGFSL